MIHTLTFIHCIVSILLIITVLVQFGKGAEAGLTMDTGPSSMLPDYKGNILIKVTSILTIIFLCLSVYLAVLRSKATEESVFGNDPQKVRMLNDDQLDAAGTKAEKK